MIEEDLHLEVLRLLEREPDMSQRQLARALGLSVGKTHYALKAVLDRGWVKAQNFRRSDNRSAYLYKLTPSGLQEKARLAYGLLQRKRAEHKTLMTEIEQLRAELQGTKPEAVAPEPRNP
ncbi:MULTISPECIES: MarR family EPS-associated transcriptional regulator [unclassified Thioalkalivibrio]|uniref:MarR family EPS-associated transcriptional regulator n=1 Tax=unclassified Thioalkalivibrio TaxID=2621013 RepID=UPI00036ACA14|nr:MULTISPECIES: MarR family EPS-associated transcriptional regulator [unclassified Thioalkalivibrio]